MANINLKEMYAIAAQHYLAGHHEKAAATYRRILKIEPDRTDAVHLLGKIEFARRKFDTALELFERCLDMVSDDDLKLLTASHRMRGEVLRSLGRHADAVEACRKALSLQPDSTPALISMGAALRGLGRLDDALACLDCVIKLEPEMAVAHNNRGNVLREMGRSAEAIASYRHALAINPRMIEAHNNLANELRNLGELEEAIALYEQALSMRPDDPVFLVNLFNVLSYACAWERRAWVANRLAKVTDDQVQRGALVTETPFLCTLRTDDPALLYDMGSAATVAASRKAPTQRSDWHKTVASPKASDRLRVGYFIDGLDNQPARRKLQTLAQSHDRDRFTVFAYCCGNELNRQNQIERVCDGYTNLRQLDDVEAAKRIAADGLDVLVDLSGHQPGGRLGIVSQRPAPVQLTWPNLVVTTGPSCADFLVTDNVTVPPADADHFGESLLYLPAGHQALGHESLPIPSRPDRQSLGLPSEGTVFACFGRALRFDPEAFDCWMKILAAVPDSVLWLGRMNRLTVTNLRAAAEASGIDPDRLIIAGRSRAKTSHLSRLACVDVWLDTHKQSSDMALMDALWAGVPAITFAGKTAPSRAGASLMKAAGQDGLVVDGPRDYVALAIDLARQPERRAQIAADLVAGRDAGALFDKAVVISRFEQMLERVAGREPELAMLETKLPSHAGVAGAAV